MPSKQGELILWYSEQTYWGTTDPLVLPGIYAYDRTL